MLSVQADTVNSTDEARKEAFTYLHNTRSEKLGNGFVNLAFGAIMIGITNCSLKLKDKT